MRTMGKIERYIGSKQQMDKFQSIKAGNTGTGKEYELRTVEGRVMNTRSAKAVSQNANGKPRIEGQWRAANRGAIEGR